MQITKDKLNSAQENGNLQLKALENLLDYTNNDELPDWISGSIEELLDQENWEELNLRFGAKISFGTGGMRGRTISKSPTPHELGTASEGNTPDHAAVVTSNFNEINLLRATKALFEFTKEWTAGEGILEAPRVVIACDVRHFSNKFSKIAAKSWKALGGYAMLFEGPRSTPQLSYTIRKRKAHAGIVITASHNPHHDNGFKAYFKDGSQLSGEVTDKICKKFDSYNLSEIIALMNGLKPAEDMVYLQERDDFSYRTALEEAVIDPGVINEHSPKIIFTPIHGTGSIATVPAMWGMGADIKILEKQNQFDPNFSTVKSPNPENHEAFKHGIAYAQKLKYDAVLATDPDCDRIGVAVKTAPNKDFRCLSGNQVAVMLADYRLQTLQRLQFLKPENANSFTLLKTFVTTDMLQKLAQFYKIKCVNTPTGFKWMAKKLGKYEKEACVAIREEEGISLDFDNTDSFTRLEILAKYSTYSVLASEESYGYLPLDVVRDKDASAAALAITEMLSHLKYLKLHPFDYLDTLYSKFGFHIEKTENIYFEGADGSASIGKIMDSYRKTPVSELNGVAVTKIKDFSKEGLLDEESEPIAQENFLILFLENGFRVAVRPSGTEPKIKFYIFGESEPNPSNLKEVKETITAHTNEIGSILVEDAKSRSI